MSWVEFVAFLIGLVILLFVTDKITIKILGVKRKKISETPGQSIAVCGKYVFLIINLIILIADGAASDNLRLFLLTTWLVLYLGFHAILEFIFIKESKQYISTTILLIINLFILFNIDRYPFWD